MLEYSSLPLGNWRTPFSGKIGFQLYTRTENIGRIGRTFGEKIHLPCRITASVRSIKGHFLLSYTDQATCKREVCFLTVTELKSAHKTDSTCTLASVYEHFIFQCISKIIVRVFNKMNDHGCTYVSQKPWITLCCAEKYGIEHSIISIRLPCTSQWNVQCS